MSLAIVDAVAEPVGEPSFGSTSRYLASIANMPLIWHVFYELAEGGVERALIVARADTRREGRMSRRRQVVGSRGLVFRGASTHGQQTVLTETSQALSSGPVLVYPADCLFPGQVAAIFNRFSVGDVDCVLLAQTPGSSLPESRMFATAVMLGPRTQDDSGRLGVAQPRPTRAGRDTARRRLPRRGVRGGETVATTAIRPSVS